MKTLLFLVACCLAAVGVRAQSKDPVDRAPAGTPARTFKAAIFISNRSCSELDGKMRTLEDLVTAKVTDEGFKVLSREAVVDAMRAFDPTLASSPRPANSIESELTNQTSILRLSQNLGADYLLVASIDSLGTDTRKIDAYGVRETVRETTLRLTYKVLDGSTGASITADAVKVSESTRQTDNLAESNGDLVNSLLDKAATRLAQSLGTRIAENRITPPSEKPAWVSITIKPEAADLYIPDVRIANDHTIAISDSRYKVSPMAVTVEVDGVAVGSAPGTIRVHPGFTHLRLTREGFKPWERTINAVDGQTLTASMELSPEGYARWRETTGFINGLKNGAKLTDAQVKALEGLSKMLEQSGFKVDTKGPLVKRSLF
ncbi:PEGA domain protein [mine drainage metagenome]|uniref:PEGA domain protein n=1 Tax=mine drainage metagenome TaxID=410659 RepID=A0A1J5T0P2_9ZZZZ